MKVDSLVTVIKLSENRRVGSIRSDGQAADSY